MTVPVGDIVAGIAAILADAITPLAVGDAEDVRTFAAGIAADAADAAAQNRPDLLAVLADQAKVVAEVNRLRIAAADMVAFDKSIQVGLGLAIKLLIPVLAAAI